MPGPVSRTSIRTQCAAIFLAAWTVSAVRPPRRVRKQDTLEVAEFLHKCFLFRGWPLPLPPPMAPTLSASGHPFRHLRHRFHDQAVRSVHGRSRTDCGHQPERCRGLTKHRPGFTIRASRVSGTPGLRMQGLASGSTLLLPRGCGGKPELCLVQQGRSGSARVTHPDQPYRPKLEVPENISINPLPPKCRSSTRSKNIWQFMRENWLSRRTTTSSTFAARYLWFASDSLQNRTECARICATFRQIL